MNFQLMRTARKQAKLTQDDIAALLDVNRATISKYETGVIEPPLSQQLKIAQILNVDLFDLLDNTAMQSYLAMNERKTNALHEGGMIVDREGVIAPVDSYVGQFMDVVAGLGPESKLDLLMIAEYFVSNDREDQRQLLRFAAFLASHSKYRNGDENKKDADQLKLKQFLQSSLISLMSPDDGDPEGKK